MADLSVSSGRESNQRQLEDLKQEQERKLQKVRADYQKREEDTHEVGQAAVSHIKKSTDERVDQLRTEGEQKLRREGEAVNREYSDLKRKSAQTSEMFEQKSRSAEETSARNIQQAKTNEAKVLEQNQAHIKDFVEKQRELRARASDEATAAIDTTRRQGNERVVQAKAKTAEDLSQTEKHYKASLQDLDARTKESYSAAKEQADVRLSELRKDNNKKMNRELQTSNRSISSVQDKYKTAVKTEQQDGDRRLTEIEKANQERFRAARDRSLETNEKVNSEYSAETQRVQMLGEGDLRQRQLHFEELKKKQESENSKTLKAIAGDTQEQELHAKQEADKRLNTEASKIDESLKEQRGEFQKRFELNETNNKETMHMQKDHFLRELYKRKEKMDGKMGIETARENDPFYRLKSFGAKLYDHQASYVINAQVAPHEKESVDIIVKDDKIVLSAKRAYADSFKDEDGDKTTTNSYQTYRQEFALETPIDVKHTIRTILPDGRINIIAPKKGFAPKA